MRLFEHIKDAFLIMAILVAPSLVALGFFASWATQGIAPFFPSVCETGWGRFAAREECKLIALQNLEAKK